MTTSQEQLLLIVVNSTVQTPDFPEKIYEEAGVCVFSFVFIYFFRLL